MGAAGGVLANDTFTGTGNDRMNAVLVGGTYNPGATPTYTGTTAHGTVTLSVADGSFTYTPTAGYVGLDSFTYPAVDAVSNTPSGAATVTIDVGGRMFIPQTLSVTAGNTVVVPVMIDSPNPAGSGGLSSATVVIQYDPTKFTVTDPDIAAGSLIPGNWVLTPNATATPGKLSLVVNATGAGANPVTSTAPGSVALITFHSTAGASGATVINLAASATFSTTVSSQLLVGASPTVLPFAVAPVNNTNFNNTAGAGSLDGIVTFTSATVGTTTTVVSSSPTVTYGTPVTFTATVTAASGSAPPTAGSVDFFDNGTLIGHVTTTATTGSGVATFTYTTTASQLQVNGGAAHAITATYTAGPGFLGSSTSGGGNASQIVQPKALTLTGVSANPKVYDGTTSATLNTGGATLVGVVPGDTVNPVTAGATASFATRNIGTNITVTASGFGISGASAPNYTLIQPSGLTANITARPITVTAAANTKGYDGTTSATATPGITSGSLASGDSASFTEVYATRNVGSGLTLTPSGTVLDGNGGNNYTVTFVNSTAGVITARAITVTAATNTKGYDGTASAAATPTITSGTLATGDSAAFTEVYSTRNVGTGLTLTPTGVVNDGNGGSNYAVTFSSVSTGVITARAITVTAATNTKGYDGTTAAAATPTIASGTLAPGDAAAFTEAYADPLPGANKTLIPAGTVLDGNGGNNYAVTLVPADLGTITAAPQTPPAVIGVGPGEGGASQVLLLNPDGSRKSVTPVFGGTVAGGVRVAIGDVNGDGVPDTVAGTGPGSVTQVVVLDGATGAVLFAEQPFESSFLGGVYVAAGDGRADVVVAPDEGGAPASSCTAGRTGRSWRTSSAPTTRTSAAGPGRRSAT